MAAKTPVEKGTTGFVDPLQGIVYNHQAASYDNVASGTYAASRNDLVHEVLYFADIDNADTFSPPPGTLSVAWQSGANGGVQCSASINAAGNVAFSAANANSTGWLHIWRRG